jgi:hypothetical protein
MNSSFLHNKKNPRQVTDMQLLLETFFFSYGDYLKHAWKMSDFRYKEYLNNNKLAFISER